MLNKERLYESDFLDRFLGFTESYSEFISSSSIFLVQEWIDAEDYDEIRRFLYTGSVEITLPFTIQDFTYMSTDDFKRWQNLVTNTCAILDEKKALYQEFISFYE